MQFITQFPCRLSPILMIASACCFTSCGTISDRLGLVSNTFADSPPSEVTSALRALAEAYDDEAAEAPPAGNCKSAILTFQQQMAALKFSDFKDYSGRLEGKRFNDAVAAKPEATTATLHVAYCARFMGPTYVVFATGAMDMLKHHPWDNSTKALRSFYEKIVDAERQTASSESTLKHRYFVRGQMSLLVEGGVVKSKTMRGDLAVLEWEFESRKEKFCKKEVVTKRIEKIEADGRVRYRTACLKFETVEQGETPRETVTPKEFAVHIKKGDTVTYLVDRATDSDSTRSIIPLVTYANKKVKTYFGVPAAP